MAIINTQPVFFDVYPEIKGVAYDFYSRKAKTDAEVSNFWHRISFSAKQHTDSLVDSVLPGLIFPKALLFS